MYSVKDVAGLLKLHPKTILRHIREKQLEAQRVGRGWRITQQALSAYTHRELVRDEPPDATVPLRDRIRVSAAIEIPQGRSTDVQRLTNSLIAMLNCKDPCWGPARCDVVIQPQADIARIVLYGTPAFLSAALAAVDVFTAEASP